jgi:morphogenetic protein associated with SpoVID
MMSNLPTPAYDVATQFRGGVLLVKIHVVQQGDTLWNIAKMYGVDFETLKQLNSQLANPDQLTPGMKIKIPQGPVHAKKQQESGATGKEKPQPKEQAMEEKPKEQPVKKPKKEEPQKPMAEKEAPKEAAKKKEDHELLKALIKNIAPYALAKLLKEEKPEVINHIKIDLDMANLGKTEHPAKPAPMPYLPHYQPVQPYSYHPPQKQPIPVKEQGKKEMPKQPPKMPQLPAMMPQLPSKMEYGQVETKMVPPPLPKHELWSPCPPLSPYLPSCQKQPPHAYGNNPPQPWPQTPYFPYAGQMPYGQHAYPSHIFGPTFHGPAGQYYIPFLGTGGHHIPSPGIGIHPRDFQADIEQQQDQG